MPKPQKETAFYRCVDIGYGVETGEVFLPAVDGPDWTGKRTYRAVTGETVYLFDREIESGDNEPEHCTEDYHVPKSMTFSPPSTYYLWCDCDEGRLRPSNVQMTKRDANRYPLPLLFESGEHRAHWEKEMREERG